MAPSTWVPQQSRLQIAENLRRMGIEIGPDFLNPKKPTAEPSAAAPSADPPASGLPQPREPPVKGPKNPRPAPRKEVWPDDQEWPDCDGFPTSRWAAADSDESGEEGGLPRQTVQKQGTSSSPSWNMSAEIAAGLDREAFKDLKLAVGEHCGANEELVSWRFLLRYPDLYVGKTNHPTVAPYFDDTELLDNQAWDFFYLYDPEALADEPILFVRCAQLEAYLRMINEKHDLVLARPDGGNEVKFQRTFGLTSTPQPRYLGRTNAATEYNILLGTLPLPDPEDDIELADEDHRQSFAKLLKEIKDDWTCTRTKNKFKKKKEASWQRVQSRKAWGRETKRVQRYLGLRKKTGSGVDHHGVPGKGHSEKTSVWDETVPAPFDLEDDVVFICFDLETHERAHKLVTEVGFAILDTRDLRDVAPGENAENWFKLIQARHIRIKEYMYHCNKEFVDGCPDKFQFGTSEVVGIDSAKKVCTEILTPKDDASGEPRKVVLVGHNVGCDVELMWALDVDVYILDGLYDIVDNQKMQQHRLRLLNPSKLTSVLQGLHIKHVFLHNAGNDAVYTLQSMLANAVQKRLHSLAKHAKPSDGDGKGTVEGWSSGGEDSDGGGLPDIIDPLAHRKGEPCDPIVSKVRQMKLSEEAAGQEAVGMSGCWNSTGAHLQYESDDMMDL